MRKNILTLTLISLIACSPAGGSALQSSPTNIAAGSRTRSVTPEITPHSSPTAPATTTPFFTLQDHPTTTPDASSRIEPGIRGVRDDASPPPPISATGWKTYVGKAFHITIAYPPDWHTEEGLALVSFVSPKGTTIQLALIETGPLSPEEYLSENLLPNIRCSREPNAAGMNARICFDTVAFTYTADFIVSSSGGSTQLISLILRGRTELDIFRAMVASVRPTN